MSDAIHDTPAGQWWLLYIRHRDTSRRETMRSQMPHLITESDRWWVLACLPEGRKSVQPAQWTPSPDRLSDTLSAHG